MKNIFYVMSIFYITSLFSFPVKEPLTITSDLEHKYSWITFVQDANNNQFMIKQNKSSNAINQFDLVLDAFGAFLAEQIGVNANKITIVPADLHFPGKVMPAYPATIHTLAPGQLIIQTKEFNHLNIHQKLWPKQSQRARRWGPLPKKRKGLTTEIIQHMTQHPDLPPLVALDTFIGNTDESNTNLFYCAETDSFCAIDFGDILRVNLCNYAIKFFEKLKINSVHLPKEEVTAIKRYRDTLEQIRTLFTPKQLCKKLEEFAAEAGFFVQNHLCSEQLAYFLHLHKTILKNSYTDAQKLIEVIDEYLEEIN